MSYNLLEDDYAHREGWVGALLEGFDVLCDTPGYVTFKSLHWRTTPSTTKHVRLSRGHVDESLASATAFCSLRVPLTIRKVLGAHEKEACASHLGDPCFRYARGEQYVVPNGFRDCVGIFCGFKIK
eukprot:gene24993-10654_t